MLFFDELTEQLGEVRMTIGPTVNPFYNLMGIFSWQAKSLRQMKRFCERKVRELHAVTPLKYCWPTV